MFRSTPRLPRPILPLCLVAALALVPSAAAPADDGERPRGFEDVEELIEQILDDSPMGFWDPDIEGPEWATHGFDAASIFFEENKTDGRMGLQFGLGGPEWKRVKIFDTNGRRVVDIKVRGRFKQIGLAEITSDTGAPGTVSRDDLLALFPTGEYRMVGKTLDGQRLVSRVQLTHDLPAAPTIISPVPGLLVDSTRTLSVRWDGVANPRPPRSVIEGYRVVIERDQDGELPRVLSIDMGPNQRTLRVPDGFLERGKSYTIEMIAVETSGHRAFSSRRFRTRL